MFKYLRKILGPVSSVTTQRAYEQDSIPDEVVKDQRIEISPISGRDSIQVLEVTGGVSSMKKRSKIAPSEGRAIREENEDDEENEYRPKTIGL